MFVLTSTKSSIPISVSSSPCGIITRSQVIVTLFDRLPKEIQEIGLFDIRQNIRDNADSMPIESLVNPFEIGWIKHRRGESFEIGMQHLRFVLHFGCDNKQSVAESKHMTKYCGKEELISPNGV